MNAVARPASTVIILRNADTGPEVLMLKRSGRAGFFPNAWVFPGGRVDPEDHRAPTIGRAMGLPDTERAFAVAAIRETFEESGVWMGTGMASVSMRRRLNARTATLSDAPELCADLSRLTYWSRWITPENEPKRYDTRFFVAVLNGPESERASADQTETVEHCWIRPIDAVERAEGGVLFMAPPTYLTLTEMTDCSSGEAVVALASGRIVQPIMPKLDIQDGQWTVVLPGDPEHPDAHAMTASTRAEFKDGRWHRS